MDEHSGLQGWFVRQAIQDKLESYHKGYGLRSKVYDRLVFGKIKNLLGKKVRLMVTGGGPIASEVLDFLKICFSCQISEAYGLAETCGGITTMTHLEDECSGHVGGPLQCVKVRLRDTPDLGYSINSVPP